jgi:hypothetical protein
MCFGSKGRIIETYSAQTSVVVPPISATITWAVAGLAFLESSPDRYAAPDIEFVGPLEKVFIGHFSACTASMMVPSFCVKNNGQVKPSDDIACLKPRIVERANLRIDVFRMVAFSLSR